MAEGNTKPWWVGKDKIVVQTKGIAKRSDFYIVDLRDNKVMKLSGGFLWNHNILYGLISGGSVIYAIGNPDDDYNRGYPEEPPDVDINDDYYHIHSGASFLDLQDPRGRWKGTDGMMLNCYRSYPSCASLGDDIFVFGAEAGTSLWYFGEFYDKKNECWQPIPMPEIDHKMQIASPIISDPNCNRILVYFDLLTSLYAYYPYDNHKWVCLDNHMSWFGQPASSPINDVLYFIISHTGYSNCITAYDILTREFLEVSWSSCSPFGPDLLHQIDDSTQLLYLGVNILCFTSTHLDQTTKGPSFWVYYRFKVHRVSPQQVLLTPLSVHRLPIPVEGHRRDPKLNTIVL